MILAYENETGHIFNCSDCLFIEVFAPDGGSLYFDQLFCREGEAERRAFDEFQAAADFLGIEMPSRDITEEYNY